jgi:hypothetical protein
MEFHVIEPIDWDPKTVALVLSEFRGQGWDVRSRPWVSSGSSGIGDYVHGYEVFVRRGDWNWTQRVQYRERTFADDLRLAIQSCIDRYE